ncbi:MAG: PH domain-containing protein [Alphaproteobacteria bacterium]|nr:MAG: PH domain-containing protein [Alphaproteobacteria bacterium]
MLYVQQSLGPKEEILMAARFHWMYTLQACFWILFGLAMGIVLGYAAVWWVITQEIREMYGGIDLDEKTYNQAWQAVVKKHHGYLKIIWGLHFLVRFGILGLFMLGLWFFAHMMVVKATTEIAVTTERLIYKKGLIARHVGELNVDRIEGVSVRQDVLARLFGYGRVCVRGMGVGEVTLPPIEQPIEFKKAIHEAKDTKEKAGQMRKSGTSDDF